jgi:hypothetical protein
MSYISPITTDPELDSFLAQVKINMDDILFILERNRALGANGTFVSQDNKTITVQNGLIIGIEE